MGCFFFLFPLFFLQYFLANFNFRGKSYLQRGLGTFLRTEESLGFSFFTLAVSYSRLLVFGFQASQTNLNNYLSTFVFFSYSRFLECSAIIFLRELWLVVGIRSFHDPHHLIEQKNVLLFNFGFLKFLHQGCLFIGQAMRRSLIGQRHSSI